MKLISYAAYQCLEKRLCAARFNRPVSTRFCSSLLQTLIHFLSVVFLHRCPDDSSDQSQPLFLLSSLSYVFRNTEIFLLESENEKSSTQFKITARRKHVVVYKSMGREKLEVGSSSLVHLYSRFKSLLSKCKTTNQQSVSSRSAGFDLKEQSVGLEEDPHWLIFLNAK